MISSELSEALVEQFKEGHGGEMALGLVGLMLTPAVIFLRGDVAPEREGEQAERAVEDTLLVKAKCQKFGELAADKLLPATIDPATREALADAIGLACMAQINLVATVLACGGKPVATNGMVGMAVSAMLKDLNLPG